MRLISYALKVPATVSAMDKYFHLMFKQELPCIDGNGKICNPSMQGLNLNRLKNILAKLSKEHPVKWQIRVHNRGTYYDFVTQDGKADYRSVRLGDNGAY